MPKQMDLTGAANHQRVSVDKLKQQVKRYANERIKHLKQHIGNDSSQVWMDRSVIETFFKSNPNATGVRIYFGVTDIKHDDFNGGVHNLIFVPTRQQGQEHVDMLGDDDLVIAPEHSGDGLQAQSLTRICPPPTNGCTTSFG